MPQTSIMYLYVYLSVTVVINLVAALQMRKAGKEELIPNIFAIVSMVSGIICMLYLLRRVYGTATFHPRHEWFIRVFYEGGTFIFGLSTFGYSIAQMIKYASCDYPLHATVEAVKTIFTLLQIIFLHCFYEARIPDETPCVRIIIPHLLGTNLVLWFWTVSSENANMRCTLGLRKYFLPLFVEYLLLAASLIYQFWRESKAGNYTETEITNTAVDATTSRPSTRGQMSLAGFYSGGVFFAVFVVFVVLAYTQSGAGYHIAYSIVVLIVFLSQTLASYIVQLCLQSHERDRRRNSVDHEDILLYFALVGIVLWEGFHAYGLALEGVNNGFGHVLDFVIDILAILQHLFQTATLVILRRHKKTQGQNPAWIRQCVLFLLVTNLALWFQDSFFIGVDISTPGERPVQMQHDLKTVGYIVHPISIFYRFHSSVCCIIAWPISGNG